MEGAGIVRTGNHAVAASDAFVVIDCNNSIGELLCRTRWTDTIAGRVIAVVAQYRQRLHF
jgi:hypothetical protein